MRDATRGGLATVLNEIADASQVAIEIDEPHADPREVKAFCEILGLDPLYLANEGKIVVVAPPSEADAALAAMRAHPLGAPRASSAGSVQGEAGRVTMRTVFGGGASSTCWSASSCRGSVEVHRFGGASGKSRDPDMRILIMTGIRTRTDIDMIIIMARVTRIHTMGPARALHGDEHAHHMSTAHEHESLAEMPLAGLRSHVQGTMLRLEQEVLARNNRIAERNRGWLRWPRRTRAESGELTGRGQDHAAREDHPGAANTVPYPRGRGRSRDQL
jgi:hypothetical protein